MKFVSIPMAELAQLLQLQLDNGGRATLTATGVSMLPMLHDRRDSVELSVIQTPLKKGDLILYRRDNGRYVVHRIVDVTADFLCCGDNQWEPETVTADQIMAVVSGFTRAGKTYPVTHKGYRLYVRIWVGMFPVRRALITLRRLLGKARRGLRRFLF